MGKEKEPAAEPAEAKAGAPEAGEKSGEASELPKDGPNIASTVLTAASGTASSVRHPNSKDGVFNSLAKVITGKNAYETEKAEPTLKLLTPASISDEIAMTGIKPGVHQHIIRGDSVYHFLKSRLRFVDANDGLYVKGVQREQITGDAKFGYLADRSVAVKVDDQLTVMGTQDIYVRGKSTAEYRGTHEVTTPEEFEWKQLERGFSALKLDMATLSTDIHVTELGIHEHDVEFVGIKTGGYEGHSSFKMQRLHIAALMDKIGAAIDVELHGNTLLSLGLDLPF